MRVALSRWVNTTISDESPAGDLLPNGYISMVAATGANNVSRGCRNAPNFGDFPTFLRFPR